MFGGLLQYGGAEGMRCGLEGFAKKYRRKVKDTVTNGIKKRIRRMSN
jgi:hypothetical protein